VGLFDSISGIFSRGAEIATDFGSGAFAAVDERLRGGRLSSGVSATGARRFGSAVGNIFGDIGESFISNSLTSGPAPTARATTTRGASARNVPIAATRPLLGGSVGEFSTGGTDMGRFISTALPGGAPITESSIGGALIPFIGAAARRAAPVVRQLPGLIGGLIAGEAIESAIGEGGGGMPTRQLTSASGRATIQQMQTQGTRLPGQVTFIAPTASGGSRVVSYRNMGRPILWSGDIQAVKRVKRADRMTRICRGRR